ncbi:Scr1 family TA system antitoxin-like transcriptional regulator [Streptomyces rimosus]|uniref:Scr1 family TA system antitoxin-like transcriptional regulator n=1 Tax=Streptomyces rimosus TaxID=1927 RepID=UPI001F3E1AB4|nr:Scr1 family TA system antitoxin-like transcriptional regulator [Streptomyces rimosus]
MRRQEVLYDGDQRYDVILGEQTLYTNVGGPELMQAQTDRLLHDIDLPSLTLRILPTAGAERTRPLPQSLRPAAPRSRIRRHHQGDFAEGSLLLGL